MKEPFSSKALEANIAETKRDIEIPPAHMAFLQLSNDYFGIHKRTKEFLLEFNHPYKNYDVIIELLRRIALDDLWFYLSHNKSEEALESLAGFFSSLFKTEFDDKQKDRLVQTLIEFIGVLSKKESVSGNMIDKVFAILEDNFSVHTELYIKSSGYLKTHLHILVQNEKFKNRVTKLMREVLELTLSYWETTTNINNWYQNKRHLFQRDYSDRIDKIGTMFYNSLKARLEAIDCWEDLCKIMFYNEIATSYRRFTDQFETVLDKIYYIFYLLHLPGMAHLKNHLMWDLNRLLRKVQDELEGDGVFSFIDSIFKQFEELKQTNMSTILDCILTLGKEYICNQNQEVIDYFNDKLIQFGFVYIKKVEIDNDWQLRIDRNHLKFIRTYLELIELDMVRFKDLLYALILQLRLGGIFISDTDLFQRDITKLLNSNVAPFFKQIKQLTRIFPIYFNEIGAEGKLRDITTEIDELANRHDRIIHFLRKQTHTESNNTHIVLTARILKFWYQGDLSLLEGFIPDDVLATVNLNGKWFMPIHKLIHSLCSTLRCKVNALLEYDVETIEGTLKQISGNDELNAKRILYLLHIHNLLKEKYSFDAKDVVPLLRQANLIPEKEIDRLRDSIEATDRVEALQKLFACMEHLKRIILSDEKTKAQEDIYYKRHIAAGIPSMYGNYREPKFEALGLTFRLEKLVSCYFEELIKEINLSYITAKTLRKICTILGLFYKGLEIDGINNQNLQSNLEMLRYSLRSSSFTLDQYINIFQFMAQSIKEIINEYFIRIYDNHLKIVIPQIFDEENRLNEIEIHELIHKKSEEFYRDLLSSTFLVQALDNFVSSILSTLRVMVDTYTPQIINSVMSYDPDLICSPLYKENKLLDNQIFLGAKAYYLKKLYSYNFPIPPGFVLTTELFRYREAILGNKNMSAEIDDLIRKHVQKLEEITGLSYGDPTNPLLLSVRSGSAISMPGAMNTFLNVGMNDDFTETLCKQHNYGWTAWDCYRRFLQSWGMAHGIQRDEFDAMILQYKKKNKVALKIQFTPEQMRTIAYAYKELLDERDIYFEPDPYLQLRFSILSVIDSWYSQRAKVYRKYLQISEEWGTAVLIQKMVLGNINDDSGTGVSFTYNPKVSRQGVNLYGDFSLCSQGEDVVSGLVNTLPISEIQEKSYNGTAISMQKQFPQIYARLHKMAGILIDEYSFSHQEIEFTFESSNPEDLYLLQTRNQIIKKAHKLMIFDIDEKEMVLLGRGMGIGGGALNGRLAFDLEDMKKIEREYPNEKHILVRPDTVPDDINMIFECDGLLTGKGGSTSHAAVTAVRLGKVCVVNCKQLKVQEDQKICLINKYRFKTGDKIAIDGRLGNIYKGHYPIKLEDVDFTML